jgi:hypothetical protein
MEQLNNNYFILYNPLISDVVAKDWRLVSLESKTKTSYIITTEDPEGLRPTPRIYKDISEGKQMDFRSVTSEMTVN